MMLKGILYFTLQLKWLHLCKLRIHITYCIYQYFLFYYKYYKTKLDALRTWIAMDCIQFYTVSKWNTIRSSLYNKHFIKQELKQCKVRWVITTKQCANYTWFKYCKSHYKYINSIVICIIYTTNVIDILLFPYTFWIESNMNFDKLSNICLILNVIMGHEKRKNFWKQNLKLRRKKTL